MSKNTNLRKITNHLTADNNVLSSNVSQTITGSLTVTGNLTAQQFILSSSVTYLTESFASGSHKFGDSSDDNHNFTGSLVVSGSANPLRVGSNLLFVSSSGNVGIGTSTPDRPLDIYSSTVLGIARIRGNNSNGVALTIQNDENAQGISIYAAGTSGFGLNGWAGNTALESETGFVYSAYNGNHIFQNGNRAERMRITSGGNVGIGTSSPSARLHTEVAVESPTTGAVALIAKTSNGVNDIFRWFDGSTQLGVFKNNGNVGIKTTSPEAALHVVGNQFIAKSGGGGTYKQTVVGQTTAAASGVAKTVAYIGHTNSIRIYVWATQSASSGMTAIKDITTTYGSSAGGNAISSGTMGNVSGINIAYDNSGYVLTISVTYSGTAPTINYVIEGINNGNDIYTI
jgi:hypothetical protein